jgi:hypothetical protein
MGFALPAHLRRTIGLCLRKFFENTRDFGLGKLKMVSTRSCQKMSDSTAQWFPLDDLLAC